MFGKILLDGCPEKHGGAATGDGCCWMLVGIGTGVVVGCWWIGTGVVVSCCWMLAGIGTGFVVFSSEVMVVTGIVVDFALLCGRRPPFFPAPGDIPCLAIWKRFGAPWNFL